MWDSSVPKSVRRYHLRPVRLNPFFPWVALSPPPDTHRPPVSRLSFMDGRWLGARVVSGLDSMPKMPGEDFVPIPYGEHLPDCTSHHHGRFHSYHDTVTRRENTPLTNEIFQRFTIHRGLDNDGLT